MSNNQTHKSYGISFCGLLTVAFIVLKLTNVINWSWLWVLAPVWLPLVVLLVVVFISAFLIYFLS